MNVTNEHDSRKHWLPSQYHGFRGVGVKKKWAVDPSGADRVEVHVAHLPEEIGLRLNNIWIYCAFPPAAGATIIAFHVVQVASPG